MENAKTRAQFHAVGRRKSSVARVFLSPGTGRIAINGREIDQYFDTSVSRGIVHAPLALLGRSTMFDIMVNVQGGGIMSQAGAVRLGISRALVVSDEALKPVLKRQGLLHCDARVKERKKYGQRGARRKFQFVKR